MTAARWVVYGAGALLFLGGALSWWINIHSGGPAMLDQVRVEREMFLRALIVNGSLVVSFIGLSLLGLGHLIVRRIGGSQ